jgi:trigger factor
MKLLKNETIEKNVVKLTIEVDKEAFAAAVEKSYKKNVKKIAIPGFRKGKAPRNIIEKYYGKGIFWEDAVNFVCPDAYEFAVKEAGIDPVDRPEIDIETLEEDENLVLTAQVTVRPEVELGEYMGISADKKNYRTKVADIDAEVKAAREKNARMVNVEDRAVKKGDFTVIDYEGFVDGVAFSGGKGENHNLEIGSGQFIPGFEDALVGAKIGVEKEINVTFPEEYHAEELKGKPAVFKVTVKSIQVKELPELNDEFAKDVSEFDTLEEYKADIKAKLDKANADKTAAEFEGNVIKEVVDASKVEIPQCMIDSAIEDMMRDFSYRLSSQGLSLEQYMQFTGMTPDAFKDQYKEQAEERVKSNLVITEIAKKENIEVTDEDVENELKNMAEIYGMELDKLKEFIKDGEKENLKEELKLKKAVTLIVGAAKVKRAAKKKEENE